MSKVGVAGIVDVLSVGKGDLRLVLAGDTPEDRDKAREVIEGMLRGGYGIFVETERGLKRVRRFNPKMMTYVIVDLPDPAAEPAKPTKPTKPTKQRKPERQVPLAGSRAHAVGATAGG